MAESHLRSVAKTFSWRVLATLITTAVAWAITRKVAAAATIGMADTLFKLTVYYAHERTWNRIPLGRPKPPEYQI